MVTIGMNYKVLEGKDDVFVAMWNKVLEVMQEDEGHLASHLYRDVNEANSFLIVSEWNVKESFDAFTRSEKFAKVVSWGKDGILAGRPRHQIYGQDDAQPAAAGCPVSH